MLSKTHSHGGIHLIDESRINEIGGLLNPEILRILGSFTDELSGYIHLIGQQREKNLLAELSATLHKLAGASRTCGFVGISRVADALLASDNRFGIKLHDDLRSVIEASIDEWRVLVSS